MAESRELQLLITAKNNANKELSSLSGKIDDLQPVFQKMRNVGALAFGAITAEIGFAVSAFADAEAQMAKVDTILKTLPTSAIKAAGGMDELKDKINAVSKANIKLGFDDEDTATSLARLTQTTGDYNEALKLNGMAMDLARFKGVDLTTATDALMKMNAGSMKELKMLGLAVDDNTTKEEAYRIVMQKTAGQAEAYANTVKGKSEALKISFANLQEGIGGALQPALQKLFDTIMPVITRFSEWAEKNPELLSKIILIAGGVAGLVTVLGILGTVIPAITAGFALFGVVSFATLLPVLAIVAGIAALIAIGVLLYKNWEEISAFAISIWNSVKEYFQNTMNEIGSAIMAVWNGISLFFSGVWEVIKNIFIYAVSFIAGFVIAVFSLMGVDIIGVITSIGNGIQIAFDWIKNAISVSLTFISSIWNTTWSAISAFLSPIFESIKSAISLAFSFITTLFNKAMKPLQDAWNSMWNSMGDTVTSIWDGVKNTIKGSINWIITQINSFIEAANKIARTGSVIPGVNVPQIQSIPYLAKGGIVTRPTLAMIGEAGPEAVVPLNKKNNGLGGITINISAGSIVGRNGMEELVEMIGDKITRQLNINGVGI